MVTRRKGAHAILDASARNGTHEESRAMRMAPDVKAWTVEDLAAMPDDGQRYEVIDGELFVTPSPSLLHQRAIARLYLLLAPYVERHAIGELVIAPADITFSRQRGVQPDLFVAPLVNGRRPKELVEIRDLVLAVEVLSPSSVRADRVEKRAMYRDQGVAEYWVIDLDTRAVERSTPAGKGVEIESALLEWQPGAAPAPLIIDLKRHFDEVLDE
jgi:Uma2 family endonuclease